MGKRTWRTSSEGPAAADDELVDEGGEAKCNDALKW